MALQLLHGYSSYDFRLDDCACIWWGLLGNLLSAFVILHASWSALTWYTANNNVFLVLR